MAATTVNPSEFLRLLYLPPKTAASPSIPNLSRQEHDYDHHKRALLMCVGSGRDLEECKHSLIDDTRITPQPMTESLFKKELFDAVECISVFKDDNSGADNKCQHHVEGLHKLMNPPVPVHPGMMQQKFNYILKRVGVRS